MISNLRQDPPARLEVWGGVECTVARIQDRYRNQIVETGHFERPDDLNAIAALGIRTLRYPVLWETISPDNPAHSDWRWHDKHLSRLRELGMAPIAGLLHHGSGPHYTHLLDPTLPDMLARHAERVATRYPWINMFTPVNEPLTTARFSGLYGHWYPHGRQTATFLRILIVQCRAVVLSMQAIRRITPAARLVQTEDLGKTFSSPLLQYQADYENERRWLSLDLLCGRIDRSHPWHKEFLEAGIGERELGFFLETPCPPDIVGINHYLTSERYLDQQLKCFPDNHHCGNQTHRYADVEAIRVEQLAQQTGPLARLREAWERYQLPMAVTEVHHGGTRDEQLRWLMEAWNAARTLKKEGADIRAVTLWSMFGCVDWNTLLVEHNGHYESGVFDVRFAPPRPTALASAATALVATGKFTHPVLGRSGWWRRDLRFYPYFQRNDERPALGKKPRILITGATGTLGQAFGRICDIRGLDCNLLGRQDMDIADASAVEMVLSQQTPWAVINTAGYVRVAEADHNAARCLRENAHGAEVLAHACALHGIPYVTFSSDLVFNGSLGRAYVESDRVCPIGTYGISKAEAERRVLLAYPQALVIRTSAFFGPWDHANFLYHLICKLSAGRQFEACDQVMVSPTYVPDLVNAALDLLIDNATGVWHLANQGGALSWHEFASRVALRAGVATTTLVKTSAGSRTITALTSERGLLLPSLDNALQRFLRDRKAA